MQVIDHQDQWLGVRCGGQLLGHAVEQPEPGITEFCARMVGPQVRTAEGPQQLAPRPERRGIVVGCAVALSALVTT